MTWLWTLNKMKIVYTQYAIITQPYQDHQLQLLFSFSYMSGCKHGEGPE